MNNQQTRARYLDGDNDKKTPGPGCVATRSATVAMAVLMLVAVATPVFAQRGTYYAIFTNSSDELTDEGCLTFKRKSLTFLDNEGKFKFTLGHTDLGNGDRFIALAIGDEPFALTGVLTEGDDFDIEGDGIGGDGELAHFEGCKMKKSACKDKLEEEDPPCR